MTADGRAFPAQNTEDGVTAILTCAAGDEVQFTDMDGTVYLYAVAAVETVQPEEVDKVVNSGHDLTLYTCTLGGKTRVTVWCDLVDANEKPE